MEQMRESGEMVRRGEQWLQLIGLEHLRDLPTSRVRQDGSPILFGDFDEICGEHVEGAFAALESGMLPPEKHQGIIALLRDRALKYSPSPEDR